MPYTVWGAFKAFRENTVDLDSNQTKKARTSRDYLFDQLKSLANKDPEFPLLTSNYLPFGSFARRTKIRPLDDVDMMIILNGRDTTVYASSPYTYWLKIVKPDAPLAHFSDDYGYVSSTKLLYKIKRLLASVPNYSKADLHKNMQAVVLNLVSYSWSFDIVPAVPIGDALGNTVYYLIPNGTGEWIRTDPRIDAGNVTRVNTQHNGQFLPTVRLLKYWNRRTHKPRLASYYFETLAIKVFDYTLQIEDFPRAVTYFFNSCPTYLRLPCQDPKRLGPNLGADVDWETKNKVSQAMSTAAEYAKCALMREEQSKHEDAIYWWQRIFGPEFPNYGQ